MKTIYFVVYEQRPEHVWSYAYTWKSLLANIDSNTKVVVTSWNSRPELLNGIPKPIEVREIPGWPTLSIWNGIRADYVKWETSREGDANDLVLFLDARDTIFQRNPFEDIAGFEVSMSCEGVNHPSCSWNMADHNAVRNYFPQNLWSDSSEWPVLNFGTIGGRRNSLRLIMLLVWMVGCRFQNGGSDQGVLNFLWNLYLKQEQGCKLYHPAFDDWCIVGDHSAHFSPAPYVQDGLVFCAASNRPYAIVHQWERGDCLWNRNLLMDKWKLT